MAFHFTEIPLDYPDVAFLDFSASNMQALFDFGVRCAEHDRLWMTLKQAIVRAEVARASARKSQLQSMVMSHGWFRQ